MVAKRMNTYRVIVRFPLADGKHLDRKIAENGLTAASAKNKVAKYYEGKGTVISVTKLTSMKDY